MQMKYPKMIMFDYGHTLLYEPDWDPVRGSVQMRYGIAVTIPGQILKVLRKLVFSLYGTITTRIKTTKSAPMSMYRNVNTCIFINGTERYRDNS